MQNSKNPNNYSFENSNENCNIFLIMVDKKPHSYTFTITDTLTEINNIAEILRNNNYLKHFDSFIEFLPFNIVHITGRNKNLFISYNSILHEITYIKIPYFLTNINNNIQTNNEINLN